MLFLKTLWQTKFLHIRSAKARTKQQIYLNSSYIVIYQTANLLSQKIFYQKISISMNIVKSWTKHYYFYSLTIIMINGKPSMVERINWRKRNWKWQHYLFKFSWAIQGKDRTFARWSTSPRIWLNKYIYIIQKNYQNTAQVEAYNKALKKVCTEFLAVNNPP